MPVGMPSLFAYFLSRQRESRSPRRGESTAPSAEHKSSQELTTCGEAITGSGRANKEQVTTMVTRILRLAERPTPADAADALALAICHVWRGGVTSKLQEAAASRTNLEALAQAQSRLQLARLRAAVAAQEGRR